MYIYLYGQDSYRRGRKLREILAKYTAEQSGLTVHYFDGEDPELAVQLRDFGTHQSLFGGKKFGVLRDADRVPPESEITHTVSGLKEAKGITLVVLSSRALGKEWDFLLDGAHQEFAPLEGARLRAYAEREAKRRGVSLPRETLSSLIAVSGEDTWALVNEIEKIALGGEVERLRRPQKFFPSVLALRTKGLGPRLSSLAELLEHEEPAAAFHVLASLVSGEEKIKMADYDVAVKSGKLEYEEALLDYALTVSDLAR